MNEIYQQGFKEGTELAKRLLNSERQAIELPPWLTWGHEVLSLDQVGRTDFMRGFAEGVRAVTQSVGISLFGVMGFVERYAAE